MQLLESCKLLRSCEPTISVPLQSSLETVGGDLQQRLAREDVITHQHAEAGILVGIYSATGP